MHVVGFYYLDLSYIKIDHFNFLFCISHFIMHTMGLQPEARATFLNYNIPQNFRNNLGSLVYHLLLLSDLRSAHQPTITGLALCHKKVWGYVIYTIIPLRETK